VLGVTVQVEQIREAAGQLQNAVRPATYEQPGRAVRHGRQRQLAGDDVPARVADVSIGPQAARHPQDLLQPVDPVAEPRHWEAERIELLGAPPRAETGRHAITSQQHRELRELAQQQSRVHPGRVHHDGLHLEPFGQACDGAEGRQRVAAVADPVCAGPAAGGEEDVVRDADTRRTDVLQLRHPIAQLGAGRRGGEAGDVDETFTRRP
jgi:hypothetical protein